MWEVWVNGKLWRSFDTAEKADEWKKTVERNMVAKIEIKKMVIGAKSVSSSEV